MSVKSFLKTYVPRALIPAAVYSITVFIFLSQENYKSIWILFLGSVLFMFTIAVVIYINYRSQAFKKSPLTSAFSGYLLSLTGSALSVILSLTSISTNNIVCVEFVAKLGGAFCSVSPFALGGRLDRL